MGRKRRGADPNYPHPTTEQRKAAKEANLPALLDDTKRAYQVYDYLKKGWSLKEIGDLLKVEPETLKTLMAQAMKNAREATADLALNWADIALARLEEMYQKLWRQYMDDDGKVDVRISAEIRNLIKLQGEIVGMVYGRKDIPEGEKHIHFHKEYTPTMTAQGKLYDIALVDAQQQKYGETHPNNGANPRDTYRNLDGLVDGIE